MWPTFARYAEAVRTGATRTTTATVYRNLVDYYSGAQPMAEVPLNASDPGTINVDSTGTVRRAGTLNTVDSRANLLPLTVTSPLSPFGPIVAVATGFTYDDGSSELVPVGVFTMTQAEAALTAGTLATVNINDLSKVIGDHELSNPVSFVAGTDASTAIRTLLLGAVPTLDVSQMRSTNQPIATVTYAIGDSPWAWATDIATSVGWEVLIDQVGRVQLQPVADPSTIPAVWTYTTKPGGGSLTSAKLVLGTENGTDKSRSHAIVESTSAGVGPFRSDAYDLNPTSPTYYYSDFGDRPVNLQSAEVLTQAACDAAAQGLLLKNVGALTQVTFTGTVVAAHDGSDVVAIDIPELGPNAQAAFVIQSFSVPLGLAEMSATTRTRHTII